MIYHWKAQLEYTGETERKISGILPQSLQN
jgi:hypothetical protein